MNEYMILMVGEPHGIGPWDDYITSLQRSGQFDGGSSIGGGERVRDGAAHPAALPLLGYLRVRAASLADARLLLAGNPHYEAGGVIEIRELPRD